MKEINISELNFNPFDKLGKEWCLITAGDKNGYNTMTASWGFMGVMWRRNCIQAVVRPSRNTFAYLNDNDTFTVSFFGEEYRQALMFCGRNSGRDVDKAKETGLVPVFEDGTTYFEQASMVIVCRKIYVQDMSPEHFTDEAVKQEMSDGEPMHTEFIGEILKVMVKE